MKESVAHMEALVERLQGGQKRQDGTSNAAHVRRVRALVANAIHEARELSSPEQQAAIESAALGHDLLEDTPATEAEILAIAGADALTWIKELTNTWGDSHTGPYIAQILASQEESRLIKFADLTDNIFHASFGIRGLGLPWMNNFFLPIVDPMREALQDSVFVRFPRAADILKMSSGLARAHLEEHIRIYKD